MEEGKGDSGRRIGVNVDCTVLVTSCDAYHDVEAPFAECWRRFWPDCPFETVLLTETLTAEGFDRVILAGKGKTWCEMLAEALRGISTSYVLLLMNDYLLCDSVDTAAFLARLGAAKHHDAANLRLNPNPPGRTPFGKTDLLEMTKDTAYCVTCQAGIWNREFLLWLAERNRSAWEFERYGSFMVGGEPRPLLVTPRREFPFIDAVHKGYWEREGAELLKRLGIRYDFAVRGLPPWRVRMVEAAKALIFAVFPWSLIVRIQNIFNIGMKERKAA